MPETIDCVVIGAGVVGLAVARALVRAGLETIILESELQIGTVTSSRNSEVIHAGIYYPPGSLKASLCVEGKKRLYLYCDERKVQYRNCEKLIVASGEEQIPKLKHIITRARVNGVSDLRLLDRQQARDLEPEVECVAAILSPSTGIIDSHGLMLSLQGDFESAGGMLAFASPVISGRWEGNGISLLVGGAQQMELKARYVINSAGLSAPGFARSLQGLNPELVPPVYFAKGNYYALGCRSPFRRLIYPAPGSAGLGVHLTLDMGGNARFGPDVEWINEIAYDVDPGRIKSFYSEIRKYWPGLPDDSLSPAYSGIRPKLHRPGEAACDFMIQDQSVHGMAGLINLFGIESPGLTASLAIAEDIRQRISREKT